jgi:hypothetical protein
MDEERIINEINWSVCIILAVQLFTLHIITNSNWYWMGITIFFFDEYHLLDKTKWMKQKN